MDGDEVREGTRLILSTEPWSRLVPKMKTDGVSVPRHRHWDGRGRREDRRLDPLPGGIKKGFTRLDGDPS